MSGVAGPGLTTVVRCGMAPDTSRPRYASFVPDGLTQIQTPDPDRCDAEPTPPRADRDTLPAYPSISSTPGLTPKPPTERGWTIRRTQLGPDSYLTQRVELDSRETDLTFENETRLHK